MDADFYGVMDIMKSKEPEDRTKSADDVIAEDVEREEKYNAPRNRAEWG